ncbi:MAG: acetyl-CoA C-acetyltransferase [Desulfovibrionales bacterium]
MRNVVIAGYVRTPQSRARPKEPERDWLHGLRADELLAAIIPELLRRTTLDSSELDDFLVGCALGVTENWTFGGRTPIFQANMDARVPARFLDQQCGSGMAALHMGFTEIAAGFADIVLACGMEHMTRVPMGPKLFTEGTIQMNPELFSHERYAGWDMDTTMVMGKTAEKLSKQTGFSREEMDAWGVRSHTLAAQARDQGFYDGEIVPIEAPQPDGTVMTVDRDQAIRDGASLESMAQLKPIFDPENGVITAGNASPLNSGAAAMVLMAEEEAQKRSITPLAVVRSIGFAGVDPTLMGLGPIPAAHKALARGGFDVQDMDFWEINEAFSVVVLNAIRELGLDPERVNVKGGGLALGHAMGATGIRLVGTLARILHDQDARLGCAASCIGGGQGVATIIERMS